MGAFAGRTALVTGAASGIGMAIARRVAREGATPVLADVDQAGAQSLAAELGGRAVLLDVAEPAAWERALDEIGPVDIACCNAGVTTGEPELTAVDERDYRRAMAINVDGVLLGTRALVRRLDRGAVIVATSSLAGLTPMASDPVYAATKHAIVGFVRSYAPTLADRGIRLQVLCPGIVDTPGLPPAARSDLRQARFPLIAVEDVAEGFVRAVTSAGYGEAWVVQAGRAPEPYRFRGVPGPRVPGSEGMVPPGVPGG